jgi:hypothetical protein
MFTAVAARSRATNIDDGKKLYTAADVKDLCTKHLTVSGGCGRGGGGRRGRGRGEGGGRGGGEPVTGEQAPAPATTAAVVGEQAAVVAQPAPPATAAATAAARRATAATLQATIDNSFQEGLNEFHDKPHNAHFLKLKELPQWSVLEAEKNEKEETTEDTVVTCCMCCDLIMRPVLCDCGATACVLCAIKAGAAAGGDGTVVACPQRCGHPMATIKQLKLTMQGKGPWMGVAKLVGKVVSEGTKRRTELESEQAETKRLKAENESLKAQLVVRHHADTAQEGAWIDMPRSP